jgi:hypothetical protein
MRMLFIAEQVTSGQKNAQSNIRQTEAGTVVRTGKGWTFSCYGTMAKEL